MLSYNLDIDERSTWLRTTPGEHELAQPFFCTEQGEFFARSGFFTERSDKDSYELFYTYRDPHAAGTYRRYAEGPAAVAGIDFTPEALSECIVGTVAQVDPPRKPRQQALEADRRYFCCVTAEMAAADRAALCGVTGPWLNAEAAALADKIARGIRCTFGSREPIERAKDLFDTVEVLG